MGRRVAVFGVGGVGGAALEGLARAGIGHFVLYDFDVVSETNLNRQIIALHSTLGAKKVEVAASRVRDINPYANVEVVDGFYDGGAVSHDFDFVVDAIDTLKSKIGLISYCYENKIPVISSFGAGNRVDASKLYCAQLENVKPTCQFSKNVIAKLKKHGIVDGLPTVASSEAPKSLRKIRNVEKVGDSEFVKFTPASTPIVPTVAGFLMANYVLNELLRGFSSAG
jgi:tRNA A37 threonylcarbamoyladenosine dehydratase